MVESSLQKIIYINNINILEIKTEYFLNLYLINSIKFTTMTFIWLPFNMAFRPDLYHLVFILLLSTILTYWNSIIDSFVLLLYLIKFFLPLIFQMKRSGVVLVLIERV